MIQPVNALTPKVFKGYQKIESSAEVTKKRIAIANAAGISAVTGALTSIVARSYTATWRNAACFGFGASLITMMFICPKMLYKSGIYTTKSEKETGVIAKKLIKK